MRSPQPSSTGTPRRMHQWYSRRIRNPPCWLNPTRSGEWRSAELDTKIAPKFRSIVDFTPDYVLTLDSVNRKQTLFLSRWSYTVRRRWFKQYEELNLVKIDQQNLAGPSLALGSRTSSGRH